MNYPEYKEDLHHIHESEVYGLALFTAAERSTINKAHKHKWRMLKKLEKQTLNRYLDYMRNSGQKTGTTSYWRLKGYAEGTLLGLMPWPIAMKLLSKGTEPFQERFLRLKRHANESELGFFNYVYDHEKAIEAFADRELAKHRDSLTAVEHLLSS